ncbi:unnamed protein product, partial [Mesorhabditis belari]|uniref:Uncharacterized protein n=1 Tax=Mesorhabditis belari TaxID=2138241 RepID=A0AAF3FDJ9_9BILA
MASERLTGLFLVCLLAFSMAISDGDDDDQVENASIGNNSSLNCPIDKIKVCLKLTQFSTILELGWKFAQIHVLRRQKYVVLQKVHIRAIFLFNRYR